MAEHVLTEVTATVAVERHQELVDGFRRLLSQEKPDGLMRTELLRGPDGQWRIQTLWRDRAALHAMRSQPEPPAAPELFRQVGARPTLAVFDVAYSYLNY